MTKRVWLVFLIMALVVVMLGIPACAKPAPEPIPTPETTPEPEPTPEPAFEWPNEFRIASSAIGSGDHAQMSALAPVLEQSTGMKVRVVPEDSIPMKARWIREGLFDGTPQSPGEIASMCMEAKGGYATRDGGPYQGRVAAHVYWQIFGVYVRGDSPIKSVYDITSDTRVALWTVPGGDTIVDAVLAWANLTRDDVIIVPTGSYPAQMRMIPEMKADVCCVGFPSSSVVMEVEAGPYGVRWLDLNAEEDPEGAARFHEFLPAHVIGPITSGVESSIGHWGWGGSSVLWTRAEEDPELMYQVTKWLDENYDSYKDLHSLMPDMQMTELRKFMDCTYLPIHEGVIRYFKEKGMWTADDDIRQEFNVGMIDTYITAYQDAITLADEQGIKIDPENEEWIALWADYKKTNNIPVFRIISDINEIKALME